MNTFKKILFVTVLIAILVMVGLYFFNYSDGSRAGTIMKFSRKGFIFKTYEGELNQVMFVDDNSAASGMATKNIWAFSAVNDSELNKSIEDAMLNGHRVKLHYREKLMTFWWLGDEKYIVYKIEVNP